MPRPTGQKRLRTAVGRGGGDGHDDSDGDGHEDGNGNENGSGDVVEEEDGEGRGEQVGWALPEGYDDRNRAFLQALLAHGSLTFRQAQPLLAAILNVEKKAGGGDAMREAVAADEITMDDMREFVGRAEAALAPLDFGVRSGVDQVRNERVWALVSTDRDPQASLAVLFTPRKLAFLQRLLGALFDTYNTPRIEAMCITEQQALRLSRPARGAAGVEAASQGPTQGAGDSQERGLKHSVVITLLRSLVRQGWLELSDSGFYTLSTRALLELESFLVETMNEADGDDGSASTHGDAPRWQRIKHCAACREILTVGLRCTKPTCTLRLHDHCEAAYWRTQPGASGAAGQRKCRFCQTAWDAEEDQHAQSSGGGGGGGRGGSVQASHYVGERAITTTDVFRRKRRQGRPSEGVDELMRDLLPRTARAVPAALASALSLGGGRAGGEEEEEEDEDEDEDDDGQGEDEIMAQ